MVVGCLTNGGTRFFVTQFRSAFATKRSRPIGSFNICGGARACARRTLPRDPHAGAVSRSRELAASDWMAGENHPDPSPSRIELETPSFARFPTGPVLPQLRYRERNAVIEPDTAPREISSTAAISR